MNKLAAMVALVVIILFTASPSYSLGPEIDNAYEWTFEVKTSQLERQFEYQGSLLKPVQKVEVTFYPKNKTDERKEYEYIWYKNGQPLGLERKHKFDIPQGEGVRIKVLHKESSPENAEFKAAANAVERIFLDAYLNRNPVEIIELKNVSFNPVAIELQNRNWEVLAGATDTALTSTVNLHLKAEDDTKVTLYYPN